jgi:hypothetical protein
MCRLYAFRANEPTRVECSLVHAQNALMEQSKGDMAGAMHGHGWGVVSQSLLQGKLILFVDTIIQQVQQIVGMQIGWFSRTDVCGSYVQSQYPAALLKLSGTI